MDFDAYSIYGTPRVAPSSASHDVSPGIATIAGPALSETWPLWHPNHPMAVFAILLAAAAGLIGFATSGHVGPASASISLGKS